MSSKTPESSSRASIPDGFRGDGVQELRTSERRRAQIQTYIEALIPSHLDIPVEVCVTPHIERAFVAPATEDALSTADGSSLSATQARELIEGTDGDYLVVVTGQAADTTPLAVSHQPTVDKEFQYALALHETLHILKTAVAGQRKILEQEVEEQYHDFVDQLINATEDGALEHELRTGDDWSRHASTRITLARKITSSTPSRDSDWKSFDAQVLTLADAISVAVYDFLIFESGKLELLLDPAVPAYQFESSDARSHLISLLPSIRSLRDDIFALRSDDPDALYQDDKEVSIKRAKRTIQFWKQIKSEIFPEESRDGGSSSNKSGGSQGEPDSSDASSGSCTESGCSETPDNSGHPSDDICGNNSGTGKSQNSPPENITLQPESVDSPSQSTTEYPTVLDEPDPDAVDAGPPQEQEPSHDESGSPEDTPSAGDSQNSPESPEGSTTTEADSVDQEEHAAEKQESALEQGEASDSGEENEIAEGESQPDQTVTTSSSAADPALGEQARDKGNEEGSDHSKANIDSQPTLDDFRGSGNQDEHGGKDEQVKKDDPSPTQAQNSNDEGGQSEGSSEDSEPADSADGGEQKQSGSPTDHDVPSADTSIQEEDLAADSDRLDHSVEQGEPDINALEEELEALGEEIEDPDRSPPSGDSETAGPGSLEELEVLPQSGNSNGDGQAATWEEIKQSAEPLGRTLANELQLNQQTERRTGLSSGSFNAKTGYKLSYGDSRTFDRQVDGDEKRYFLVLVLDRSALLNSD